MCAVGMAAVCQMWWALLTWCSVPLVTAVIVNYNSGQDCARLLGQLDRQVGVSLRVVVIDSDSSDDSLSAAREAALRLRVPVTFLTPGRNVGYTGNNLALIDLIGDAFVCNPDVEVDDAHLLAGLVDVFRTDPTLAAVAPTIRRPDGRREYTSSLVDLGQAAAYHPAPDGPDWPHTTDVQALPWVNGAAWLLRSAALDDVGLLDERFFLFCEEVDWCLRATAAGWRVALSRDQTVRHRRSSSFDGTKGSFYYWRNLYLLCEKHPEAGWRRSYHRRLAKEGVTLRGLVNGNALRAVEGYVAARRGAYGPSRQDR